MTISVPFINRRNPDEIIIPEKLKKGSVVAVITKKNKTRLLRYDPSNEMIIVDLTRLTAHELSKGHFTFQIFQPHQKPQIRKYNLKKLLEKTDRVRSMKLNMAAASLEFCLCTKGLEKMDPVSLKQTLKLNYSRGWFKYREIFTILSSQLSLSKESDPHLLMTEEKFSSELQGDASEMIRSAEKAQKQMKVNYEKYFKYFILNGVIGELKDFPEFAAQQQ